VDHDHNARILRRLHRAYLAGRVDLLVGAGPSIGSGLPTWTQLNLRLLARFLDAEHGYLELQRHDLTRMSERFVESFGREPVVDLVRSVRSREYQDMLHSALYGDEPFAPDALRRIAKSRDHCGYVKIDIE